MDFYNVDGPPDWQRHNRGITPSFFIDEKGRPILDATGSPSEHIQECVRISIAGDCFTEAVQPVDDVIKQRFAEQYARWKANDLTINGTRLEDWTEGNLSERVIKDMADLNIRSVEDLASLADVHVSRLINGRDIRRKAIEWLEARPKAAELGELAEMKKQNDALMARIDALEKMTGVKKSDPAMKAKMSQLRARKKKPVGKFLAELDAKKAADAR